MAKREIKRYIEEGSPYVKLMKIKGNIWQVKIKGKTVVKNIVREILHHKWDLPLKKDIGRQNWEHRVWMTSIGINSHKRIRWLQDRNDNGERSTWQVLVRRRISYFKENIGKMQHVRGAN